MERALELIKEKQTADAPVAYFETKPVTKGKGRFGPFIKWNNLYINVPVRYNFENLGQAEINELISNKVEKESNRFIQQWTSDKIALENGRWGPFIRFGKQMLKLGKNPGTKDKYTAEELASLSLETVKKLIEEQIPDAFAAKSKKVVRKAPAKKSTKKLVKK
jgi:DNA topoisomerase-1